jgi:hypothetical protein
MRVRAVYHGAVRVREFLMFLVRMQGGFMNEE